MSEAMIGKMYKLVTALMDMKDAGPFLEPVDYAGLGLLDYPDIISHPMDLGTIKRKCETGQYQKYTQMAEDIRLVWNNCKTYNQEESPYWKIADKMSQRFEDRYLKIRAEDTNLGAEDADIPSLDEKRQFRANMYRITSEDLGEIVKILEEKSPAALDKVTSKDEMEINIDKITPQTFHYLADYVRRKLPDKKAKKKKLGTEADGGPLKKK